MNRYAAIPWPLAGIVVALARGGIDHLGTSLGPNPALAQTVYRTVMWTIGIASLGLLLLPSRRRVAYFLGFLVCAALMAFALYLQYAMDLEPCPLCVFQRIALIATGVVFLVAALHNPRRGGASFYAVLTLIAAGIGAGLAAWQVWIQGQPKGSVPACGMGLDYMLDTMPLFDVITRVLRGSGECAEQGWVFLGMAIPSWTFVFFVAMIAAAFALIRRDGP
jgi:disulfide bond formation protein DsbB